ncbi:DUF4230 domain-containing protein [Streptomyces sp. AK02-01A]|uniref:DUF4230 domain-containing protein n=1 Tax=Streptomyces sp. AK02-01A TaxID=3028648 RepID=UPI00299F9A2E|nr:DUF4230 domain-containing protein [Streptomyces sp. AK02-01A]MDX3849523.1 DUF4230 domain-containing protein [Streptomyces sp. AK02-01A]MDX3849907.1 DUF4230 domain-containing protein [Streptomyces sp. AK02-01A]
MTSTEVKPEEPRSRTRASRLSRWGKLPIALVVVAALLFLGSRLDLLPGFGDLFGEETQDRTGPTLLRSIQDLDRYEAASGNFQVVVDLEKDATYLPDAIRGTRTLYVGAGTVGAYVDFGGIGEDSVQVNEARTAATIRLPHARLGKPALDPDRSYAVSKERGLLDRLGDLFSDNPADERAVNRLAAQHIGDAAKDSELTARAEKNTTGMLEGLLRSLGFTEVKVVYA